MLAQQREFYLVLMLVFLIQTLKVCSSLQCRATAESTLDNNFLSKVHSHVARSDDDHSQINVHTSLEDPLSNRSLIVDEVYRAKASSTRKYVVVFDIDDCLCSGMYYEKRKTRGVKKAMRLFPECPPISYEYRKYLNASKRQEITYYAHFFLPYLQILFEYLLDQGVRIVFFSGGIKQRNDEVIPELLKLYWGSEKYESFRSEGQFMTFCRDDLIANQRDDPTHKTCGNTVKDLRTVIRDKETFSDVVLVDDDFFYAQRPFIPVHNLYLFGEALNNVYYMFGLFKTYFEKLEYRELPLREGIGKIFSENQVEDKRYLRSEHSFTIRMINNGLLEVQKVVPKARLYSKADKVYWGSL